MKISLFQGIMLGVFGVGGLIGLFVFATYTSSNSSSGIGAVTIWGTLPQAEIRAVLTEASKSNQQLKGLSYVQKDPSTLEGDLTTAIASGTGPDLVLISQEDLLPLTRVLQEIPAASLSASTFSKTFAEAGIIYYAPDASGTYGIPFLIDPLILYDNRALLSSAGIATPPTSWEALTGLVPKVTRLGTAGAVGQSLIALGTYSNIHDARAILSALLLQAGAPISARSSGGVVSAALGTSASAGGVPPGQAVLRFYTQFADPSKVSYTWNASLPDSEQAFLAGDSALYLGFASEARFLSAANPNLDFEPAPLPEPATAPNKSTYGLVYAFAIPRGAVNASGALAAAAALTASSVEEIAASATGLAPSLRSLLAAPPADPVGAVAYASALYTSNWLSPAPAATDGVFSAMISNVISGRTSIPTALATASQALSALLQQ